VIVEGWHGRVFDPPLSKAREAVEATRAALAGERDYGGRHVSMQRFRLAAPPAGPVPLYVGALGPGMLRLAGAIGDGVCLNLMPPSVVPRQLAEVRAGAAAAGRELADDFGVMARFHTAVSDDLDRARSAIRAAFGPYFAQPVYNRFLAWCGYPEEAAAIAQAWADGDREALAMAFHDGVVDAVALIGTPATIRERLEAFADAGITVAALNFLAPDAATLASAARALAPA
jgi:alkanesulfonate monooxygenase SsuD/methylene tetrahydromethanopterin reductase-like flavin-dependent oxidoreductase (luciferase family)